MALRLALPVWPFGYSLQRSVTLQMYGCFISGRLFRERQGSDEDTQSKDTDCCPGKWSDVCCIIPVRSDQPKLGLGWGFRGLNNHARDTAQEVSGEMGLGILDMPWEPSPETRTGLLGLLPFHSIPWLVHLENNANSSNSFICIASRLCQVLFVNYFEILRWKLYQRVYFKPICAYATVVVLTYIQVHGIRVASLKLSTNTLHDNAIKSGNWIFQSENLSHQSS